ncbi:hypothetical protein GCM10009530_38700 [Microbispora corallina]|uniref:DUF6879 domain-containing protein n=1 Tax=Microbispora corallina TaxID=83302 RepID=A0ABQ4G2K7_9ACTN|nr:DUF6879 family protein [Microbispora corallina]GIH41318.1 hypothetical protein Mco01_43180 [Microbispora corallina]
MNARPPRIDSADGRVLPLREYAADFLVLFHEIDGVIWKLERAQDFDEGDNPSWNAMRAGDWERSLALLEEAREAIAADLPARATMRRVRVVEWPLTPYMQWELHLLALRERLGEGCRVVAAEDVAGLEADGPLPELVIFPGHHAYRVRYDERGACVGARKVADPAVVEPWTELVASLYDRAEDLGDYVRRRVEPLPPPAP